MWKVKAIDVYYNEIRLKLAHVPKAVGELSSIIQNGTYHGPLHGFLLVIR